MESETAYREVVANGPHHLANLLQSMRGFLGQNDMMAYLAMMAPRLAELHRVLKPTGSIYLHCDQTAGHLLRLLLDAVFGAVNFKTQIVWKRTSAHSDTRQGRRQHGRIQDNILFATKSDEWNWNPVYTPYDREYIEEFYRHIEPETGRRYTLDNMTGPGGASRGNPEYEVLGVTRAWRYSMMAYLAMMAPRLAELHRVLKPTGSIYLHCDQTAGHLLRLLLDAVFGAVNFKTQIVWKRTSAHSDTRQGRRQHGRIQDNILFATKSDEWNWNPVYTPYDREYIEEFYRHIEPETGRRYTLNDMTGPGGANRGNPEYEVLGVTRAWRYSRERMQGFCCKMQGSSDRLT